MSRRRELDLRLRKLEEIGAIMRSMKNLALMESRRLARLLDAQAESVRLVEAAAADFLSAHPRFVAREAPTSPTILAIGAERGFCGDFNEDLLEALEAVEAPIIAVGNKLCARLERHPALAGRFDGPTVAEDVPAVLQRLAPALGRPGQDGQGLAVLHRGGGGLNRKLLLPPFAGRASSARPPPLPPLLNLPAERFFAELVRHHLFAALHEIFYASLLAENQRRISHLEGAAERLEEKAERLARQSRTLRQEEITEEIEVILLSVEDAAKR